MNEDQLLASLISVVAERAELERRSAQLEQRRDELVSALMQTRTPRETIAAAAGLKVARLYQIRDGQS
jgi:hypothetical protein